MVLFIFFCEGKRIELSDQGKTVRVNEGTSLFGRLSPTVFDS